VLICLSAKYTSTDSCMAELSAACHMGKKIVLFSVEPSVLDGVGLMDEFTAMHDVSAMALCDVGNLATDPCWGSESGPTIELKDSLATKVANLLALLKAEEGGTDSSHKAPAERVPDPEAIEENPSYEQVSKRPMLEFNTCIDQCTMSATLTCVTLRILTQMEEGFEGVRQTFQVEKKASPLCLWPVNSKLTHISLFDNDIMRGQVAECEAECETISSASPLDIAPRLIQQEGGSKVSAEGSRHQETAHIFK
jgi:hypothetical protein